MYSQGGFWVPAVITSAPCARCKARDQVAARVAQEVHTHKLGLGIGRFQSQAVWGQFHNGGTLRMEFRRIVVVATFAKVPQGVKQHPNTQPQAQECHPQRGGRISNWQKVRKRLAITDYVSAMNSKIFIRTETKALKSKGNVKSNLVIPRRASNAIVLVQIRFSDPLDSRLTKTQQGNQTTCNPTTWVAKVRFSYLTSHSMWVANHQRTEAQRS